MTFLSTAIPTVDAMSALAMLGAVLPIENKSMVTIPVCRYFIIGRIGKK